MTIHVTAVLTVSADPASLDADREPLTTVFPVSARESGLGREDESLGGRWIDVGEVVCRGRLAEIARSDLRAGDVVAVSGALGFRQPRSMDPDAPAVLVTFRAETLAKV